MYTVYSILVNTEDVGETHPPVCRLGRALGWLGHLGETSWEVAGHNTNLKLELSQYQPRPPPYAPPLSPPPPQVNQLA